MSNTFALRLALLIALIGSACSSTPLAPTPKLHADPSGALWIAPPEPAAVRPAAWSNESITRQDHGEAEEHGTGAVAQLGFAQEAGRANDESSGHAEAHEHAERGTHVLDLFLGGTDELRGGDGYTAGLDYGYHLAEAWGVGAFAEFVSGTQRSFASGVMAFYHPIEPWFIATGPGMEYRDDEWEPMWRVVTSWEIHIHEGLFLAPTLAYDWNEEDGFLVYGLSFGIVR